MQRALLLLVATGVLALGFGVASIVVWARSDDQPAASNPAAAATTETVDYGRRLFVAKGCAGCHYADGITSGTMIGPNLSVLDREAGTRVEGVSAADYVRMSILAPGAFLVPGYGQERMPQLPVSNDEVDALVAFLLHDD